MELITPVAPIQTGNKDLVIELKELLAWFIVIGLIGPRKTDLSEKCHADRVRRRRRAVRSLSFLFLRFVVAPSRWGNIQVAFETPPSLPWVTTGDSPPVS